MNRTEHLFGLTDELPSSGKVTGYAKIPFSSDLSAYGFIPLPITVVAEGDGPTVLLLAGSYGDEFDSQIALGRVARNLDPRNLNGRVIIVPMANEPAARASTRNSPIDGLNLNRSYPGDVRGTPTRVIADYLERQLMPISDIVLDLHSDARSIRYLPCATMIYHADPDVRLERLALAMSFDAPSVLVFHSFEERNSSGAAKRAGAVRIATEIGGPKPVEMTFAGIMNVLRWAGVVEDNGRSAGPKRPVVRVVRQDSDFVYALLDGLFEPTIELGDEVSSGTTAGFIHDPSRPLAEPYEVKITAPSGTVVCTRGSGPARRGDCLIHMATAPDAELASEIAAASTFRWPKERQRGRPQVTQEPSTKAVPKAPNKKPRSRPRVRRR
ncbi:MAG: succinylglutamate desuccinylase/aspartoacylase family protein [Proteobacteria bacterium]|nr:succinylglutamate desuccinylase/aspartoacylase family protein [Pseudomonadota bacterium]